jgi:hypothetical protein
MLGNRHNPPISDDFYPQKIKGYFVPNSLGILSQFYRTKLSQIAKLGLFCRIKPRHRPFKLIFFPFGPIA